MIDSARYDTGRNLTQRSMMLRGTMEKYKYLSENEAKNENILTHWSMAQTCWTVPLRDFADTVSAICQRPRRHQWSIFLKF